MAPGVISDEEAYEPEDRHYLEDEDYAEFVSREFDARGGPKRGPPVGIVIGVLVLVLLVLALFLAR